VTVEADGVWGGQGQGVGVGKGAREASGWEPVWETSLPAGKWNPLW
jgi:hypothetical protein